MNQIYCRFLALSGFLALATIGGSQDQPRPAFQFTDVTEALGLDKAFQATFTHAMAWGDFDGDGRLDFFLGTFSDRNAVKYGRDKAPFHRLFRQSAGGKFEHVASPAVELPARCSGAVFVDLDNDGDLDLYVSSNRWEVPSPDESRKEPRDQGCRLYRQEGGAWVDISADSGACPLDLFKCRDIGVLDYDNDGLLDLLVLQEAVIPYQGRMTSSRLFRNLGKMRFRDVTQEAGLPADLWGYGIALADLNADGRLDFYVAGSDRLFLSQPKGAFKESDNSRPVLDHKGKDLDRVTGAHFGDLDLDGHMDLISGPHNYHGPSRIHAYHNSGLNQGVPQFREVTKELGLPDLPQKAPHPEIQDFDNDGIPDLFWSAFTVEGNRRWPFICKGLGVKDGLPRYRIPEIPAFQEEVLKKNVPAEKGKSMIYYVDCPVVDFDGDGGLDLPCGNWPPAGTRFFHNETPRGHWLQVRVEGTKMNRMGVGAQVRLWDAGRRLLGHQHIQVNGGYSASRPALVHFGLGTKTTCDVEVRFPSRPEPLILKQVAVDRVLTVREPE